jgi:hypothetical protein
MLAPRDVSFFLNNALKASHGLAELDAEQPLPDRVAEMPDLVKGRFVALEPAAVQEIAAAWKRVMILNSTSVLYSFTLDPDTGEFTARKR